MTAGQSVGDYTPSSFRREGNKMEISSGSQLFALEAPLEDRTAQAGGSGLDGSGRDKSTANGAIDSSTPSDPCRAYKDVTLNFNSIEDRDTFLRWLLESGEDVDATDEEAEDGRTPLHVAAESGSAFAIGPLIEYGASLNRRDYFAATPLFLAARGGHFTVAAALLGHGADPNIPNTLGDTPLHAAVRYGHHDVAQCLLSNGANVHAMNHNNSTPLHWASSFNRWDIMTMLIEHGASLAATDCDGDTPLHLAADFGAMAAITKLAGSRVDLDAKNMAGQTALHRAALGGYARAFILLLSLGASEYATDVHGYTALDYNTVRARLAEAINDRTLEVSWGDEPELFGTESIVKTRHGPTGQMSSTTWTTTTTEHESGCMKSAVLNRVCWCGERISTLERAPVRQHVPWFDGAVYEPSEYCSTPHAMPTCYHPDSALEPSYPAHVGCREESEISRLFTSLPVAQGHGFTLVSA